MQPDLAIAGAVASATMAAVAAFKKVCPEMAGWTTALIAGLVSCLGTCLGYMAEGITAQNAGAMFLTWVSAWVGAVGVAWAVRNPQRNGA